MTCSQVPNYIMMLFGITIHNAMIQPPVPKVSVCLVQQLMSFCSSVGHVFLSPRKKALHSYPFLLLLRSFLPPYIVNRKAFREVELELFYDVLSRLWLGNVQGLADHQAPVQNEHQDNGVELERCALSCDTKRNVFQNPPL